MIQALAAVAASAETSSRGFPLWMVALLGVGIGAAILAFRRRRSDGSAD